VESFIKRVQILIMAKVARAALVFGRQLDQTSKRLICIGALVIITATLFTKRDGEPPPLMSHLDYGGRFGNALFSYTLWHPREQGQNQLFYFFHSA
jgi:hypothetical protein